MKLSIKVKIHVSRKPFLLLDMSLKGGGVFFKCAYHAWAGFLVGVFLGFFCFWSFCWVFFYLLFVVVFFIE